MTPIEDSQSSEELLATEDNTSTAPLPSNSGGVRTNIRVRNVSELNNNNEAEATPSNASAPTKRRCLPSWMLSAQGNSENKKKKPESTIETPESTSSSSTSKSNLEKESCESSNQNINETNESSTVDSSGARENDSNPNEQMEIESSSIHNDDEPNNNENVEAQIDEEASVASTSKSAKTEANSDADVASTSSSTNAQAGANEDKKKDDSEVDGDAGIASSSNQCSSPSKVTIKTEPKDDDNEAVGQVTATSPKDIKPAVKVEKEEATSSTTRVSCKFGIRCYRRNQMHRVEEAHPGDSDYRRPDFPTPPDGTPPCPYGDLCYRRNPVHFQQYTHPASTDFKQNWKLHQMRLRDRKKNQQPKVDPDSDEDDEEVFIDSSEEFDIGDEIDDDDEEESEDFY
ncbi:aprataxin and PNK-like factor [Episyrphus balteatus]|uniref:aprataxin and PNK-like factor n=1 Tax=Episyrphus balteatus TaxID=286459 RepID=UPI002485FFD9|nr:aprataxin and PNK-like factor [Episyrphus balteatus]